jgi:hypothetical protein
MVSRSEKCPGGSHRPEHSPHHSVSADVHETQAASGLNVLVAIAADVEGRTAVEMTVTMMVAVMAMTVMAMPVMSAVAVAVTTMSMTTACRSRGHGGSTEGDSGNDGE